MQTSTVKYHWEMKRCGPDSPLYRLHVVQKGPEAANAFKDHGSEAPVVHSYSVGFILKQLWRLEDGFIHRLINRACLRKEGLRKQLWSHANQILNGSNKGGAKTALIQVFGITQIYEFMDKLEENRK